MVRRQATTVDWPSSAMRSQGKAFAQPTNGEVQYRRQFPVRQARVGWRSCREGMPSDQQIPMRAGNPTCCSRNNKLSDIRKQANWRRFKPSWSTVALQFITKHQQALRHSNRSHPRCCWCGREGSLLAASVCCDQIAGVRFGSGWGPPAQCFFIHMVVRLRDRSLRPRCNPQLLQDWKPNRDCLQPPCEHLAGCATYMAPYRPEHC
jgi:hypothetical protein